MPGSLLEPVFEIVFRLIGYGTAKLLVPRLTGGKIDIEPSGKKGEPVGTKSWVYRRLPCGTVVLSADLGMVVGIVLWGLIVFALVKFLIHATT